MIFEFEIEIKSENLKAFLSEWLSDFAEIEDPQVHYTTLFSGPYDTLKNKTEMLRALKAADEVKQVYFSANNIGYSVLIDDVSMEFVMKSSLLNVFSAEQKLNTFMAAIQKSGIEAKVLNITQPY